MKRKPKINRKKQWERCRRRAFKVTKAWWKKQMPPQGWGVRVVCYDDTGNIIVVGG